jgi:hypothetical protein
MDVDRRSSKAMCHLPPESTRVLVLVCAEAHQTRTSGERARAACADSSCSRKTRAGSEEQEVVMPVSCLHVHDRVANHIRMWHIELGG